MGEQFLQLKPHRHTFPASFSEEKALMLCFFGGVGGGSLNGGVLTRHDHRYHLGMLPLPVAISHPGLTRISSYDFPVVAA